MEPEALIEDERVRLVVGVNPTSAPAGILVSYLVRCGGDALDALAKAKAALIAVDERTLGDHSSTLQDWAALLPSWFVEACKPESSREQAVRDLEWWDGLDEAAKLAEARSPRPWSLGNWIYWFEPGRRTWFWWDARVIDAKTLTLSVQVEGLPFASGSLEWLLRAAGAREIEQRRPPGNLSPRRRWP